MLSGDEKAYFKKAINSGFKTKEIVSIIMTHRTRTKSYPNNYTLEDVQREYTSLMIDINKELAKLQ